jgi:hypothetical protein
VTTIGKRVKNLEKQFGASGGTQQLLLVVSRAGWGLALDQDTCLRILGEAGFLPTGRMGIVTWTRPRLKSRPKRCRGGQVLSVA